MDGFAVEQAIGGQPLVGSNAHSAQLLQPDLASRQAVIEAHSRDAGMSYASEEPGLGVALSMRRQLLWLS